jgi:hypothetical protein
MSAMQQARRPLLEPQAGAPTRRATGAPAELRVARARSVLGGTRLSPDQVRRGLVLLLAFVALRVVLSAFASGLLFGWLRLVRGPRVVPGFAHGLPG